MKKHSSGIGEHSWCFRHAFAESVKYILDEVPKSGKRSGYCQAYQTCRRSRVDDLDPLISYVEVPSSKLCLCERRKL